MADFAPTALLGTITRINSPYVGWYTASVAPFADYEVFGTPLRISSFTVGEQVQVFQCFFYNNTVEYGFAKLTEYDYGAVQIPPPMYDQFLERYRYGMTLAWLCNKANKTEMMFSPGIVEEFITSGGIRIGLRVRMRYTGQLRPLGVTPDIADLDDFEIGDGVLVSHWPNPGRAVIGWWQTVKGVSPGVFEVPFSKTTFLSSEKDTSFVIGAQFASSTDIIQINGGEDYYNGFSSVSVSLYKNDILVFAGSASTDTPANPSEGTIRGTKRYPFAFETGAIYRAEATLTWSGTFIRHFAYYPDPETSIPSTYEAPVHSFEFIFIPE